MKKHLLIMLILSCSVIANGQINLDSSMVLYLPFNGNANDSSGNNNNGMVYGATLTTDQFGNPNSAYYFDGSGSYIEIPDHPTLNPTHLTMFALIKPSGFYSGLCQGNAVIWKGNNQTTGHYGISFSDNVYDGYDCNNLDTLHEVFYPEISTNATAVLYPSYISSNTWYCIISTYDGDSCKLYINGDLIYSSYAPTPIGISSSPLDLGYNIYNSAYAYWFHGIMDEIRLYSRVLNSGEINALCSSGTGIQENNFLNSIHLYPNPNSGNFNIEYPRVLKGRTEVFNAMGECVFSEEIMNVTKKEIRLNNASAGLYVIRIFDGKNYYFQKFTVSKN